MAENILKLLTDLLYWLTTISLTKSQVRHSDANKTDTFSVGEIIAIKYFILNFRFISACSVFDDAISKMG